MASGSENRVSYAHLAGVFMSQTGSKSGIKGSNSNQNHLSLPLLLLPDQIPVFVRCMTLVSTSSSGQEQSVLHGYKNETMLWESHTLESSATRKSKGLFTR
jgi:hypothetical protein